MKLALLDMDGTLSDDRHRKPLYIPGQNSEYWTRENMLADPLFPQASRLVDDLREQGWTIGILCARIDSLNTAITKEWLAEHDIDYDYMWLKPEGSKGLTPPEFKEGVMSKLLNGEVHSFEKVVLFDNDPLVVARISDKLGPEHVVHCTWDTALEPA